MMTYAFTIGAVLNEEYWPKNILAPLKPPRYSKAHGRPKKGLKESYR